MSLDDDREYYAALEKREKLADAFRPLLISATLLMDVLERRKSDRATTAELEAAGNAVAICLDPAAVALQVAEN